MAFQIADDLLDYTGDPDITGKPRGSDLRDGRATLPFLLALDGAGGADKKRLLGAFGNAGLDDAGVLDACEILGRHDCFDLTREAARDHVEQADAALAMLPDSAARNCFAMLTDYVVQRDR
jgi:octaprenyl-diphosphate synthase